MEPRKQRRDHRIRRATVHSPVKDEIEMAMGVHDRECRSNSVVSHESFGHLGHDVTDLFHVTGLIRTRVRLVQIVLRGGQLPLMVPMDSATLPGHRRSGGELAPRSA